MAKLTKQVMVFDDSGRASVIKTTPKREGLNWQHLQLHGLTETALFHAVVTEYLKGCFSDSQMEVQEHEKEMNNKLDTLVNTIRQEVPVPAGQVLHITFRKPRLDVVVRPKRKERKGGIVRGTFDPLNGHGTED
jgi:hypothetical protein